MARIFKLSMVAYVEFDDDAHAERFVQNMVNDAERMRNVIIDAPDVDLLLDEAKPVVEEAAVAATNTPRITH